VQYGVTIEVIPQFGDMFINFLSYYQSQKGGLSNQKLKPRYAYGYVFQICWLP